MPILTSNWEGIKINLLFARIMKASVPPRFDIDKSNVLDGVDTRMEKSLK